MGFFSGSFCITYYHQGIIFIFLENVFLESLRPCPVLGEETCPFVQKQLMDATKGPEDVATVDVHAAKDLLGSGHSYLDVRTVEEFNKSHIEKALNVPYMFITQQGRVKNPHFLAQVEVICQKDDHLVVGCNSGGRSLHASVDLLKAGYGHVTNMGGGYSAWVDSGLAGSDKPAEELKTACKFRP